MRAGVGGEDARRVRSGPPVAAVMFVPDQRIPVDTKHRGGAQEGTQVLAGKIVGHFSPGKLSHTEYEIFPSKTKPREDYYHLAMATVIAGLRCPPETPPLTMTPIMTPTAHLQRSFENFKESFLKKIIIEKFQS